MTFLFALESCWFYLVHMRLLDALCQILYRHISVHCFFSSFSPCLFAYSHRETRSLTVIFRVFFSAYIFFLFRFSLVKFLSPWRSCESSILPLLRPFPALGHHLHFVTKRSSTGLCFQWELNASLVTLFQYKTVPPFYLQLASVRDDSPLAFRF